MYTRFSKFFGAAFAAAAMVMSSGVSAGNCGDCCCDLCDLTDDWCVSGYIEVPIKKVCEDNHYVTRRVTATDADMVHYVDWDWGFGVNAGLSFLLPCPNWALNVDYSYFTTDGDDGVAAGAGATNLPSLGGLADATSTSVSIDMDIHQIDVLISRECCVCDTLQLNPYAGFRALILDRDAHELSSGGSFTTAGDGGRNDHSYTGFGLASGINWQHCAFESVRFFGKFGGSVLCGEDELKLSRTHAATVEATLNDTNDCHITGSLETAAGFAYEHCFCDWNMTFSFAYEAAYYYNVSTLFPETAGGTATAFNVSDFSGELGLHGFVLGVGFEF